MKNRLFCPIICGRILLLALLIVYYYYAGATVGNSRSARCLQHKMPLLNGHMAQKPEIDSTRFPQIRHRHEIAPQTMHVAIQANYEHVDCKMVGNTRIEEELAGYTTEMDVEYRLAFRVRIAFSCCVLLVFLVRWFTCGRRL